MSVVETDDRDRGTVLHYAPRHVRHPSEDRSIRPILERLRRGESDASGDVHMQTPPQVVFDRPRRSSGWELVACSTLSAVLSAGLALVATEWFAPMRAQPARIESAQLEPKVFNTFPLPQPAADTSGAGSDKNADTPPAQVAEQDARSKAQPPGQIAPKDLLAMWSGVPIESYSSAGTQTASAPPSAAVQAPEVIQNEAPPTPGSEPREAPPRRHAHARHHSHRRAHASPRSGTGNAAQSSESNPLQSALQSVFGKPAADAQQQNGAAGAASQPQPHNY